MLPNSDPSNLSPNQNNNMDGPGSPYDGPAYAPAKSKTPRFLFRLLRIAIVIAFVTYFRNNPDDFVRLIDKISGNNSQHTASSQSKNSWELQFTPPVPLGDPIGTFVDTIETEEQNSNLLHIEKLQPASFIVGINPMQNLSGMTRDQVIQERRNSVADLKKGFDSGNYTPFSPIFEGITDGKPWWGIDGITLYGPGQDAIKGNSYRSNSLLNPLALLWPNVWDVTFPTNKMIDLSKAAPNGKVDALFPYLPKPKTILVDPATHTISMHIDVSSYNKSLERYTTQTLNGQILVEFEGVNARDLGYPFIALEGTKSTNMTKMIPTVLATRDFEYYHTGGSCGYQDGCNNLSPRIDALQNYAIMQLPAKAQFKLWHKKPANFSDKADIVYIVYFD